MGNMNLWYSFEEQCSKIAILLGCQSGKFGPQKDGVSGKFGGKCGMNEIYVENYSVLSEQMALVAVLQQSLVPNHQLRARNSP